MGVGFLTGPHLFLHGLANAERRCRRGDGRAPERSDLLSSHTVRRPVLLAFHAAVIALAFGLAYVPDMGKGLVKDDFRWIAESRVRSWTDAQHLLTSDNGFYRPVVSLSFAANEAVAGAHPMPYAATNLLLVTACALALFGLCRALRMEAGAALMAVGLWVLNPHGISGLIMWISGRTSSLVTLLAVLAGIALLKERRFLAGVLCFLALLSKEEAFLLPFVLVAWAGWQKAFPHWDWRRAGRLGWPALASLAPYLALRGQTHAYLPSTAPSYYRLAVSPALVGRNFLEYADRSATLTLAVLVVMLLATRRRPGLSRDDIQRVALGAVWVVGGFGLTLFLPARSSLYVCLPSIGVAVAGATAGRSLWSRAGPRQRAGLLAAAALVPLLLVPVLHARNGRMRSAARLSTTVLAQLQDVWRAIPPGGALVLVDAPTQRPNLRESFGSLVGDALALATGDAIAASFSPSPDAWTEAQLKKRTTATPFSVEQWRLENDRLVRDEASTEGQGLERGETARPSVP